MDYYFIFDWVIFRGIDDFLCNIDWNLEKIRTFTVEMRQ
jgi:hypothetical protein